MILITTLLVSVAGTCTAMLLLIAIQLTIDAIRSIL
jgi:hypothetical protein